MPMYRFQVSKIVDYSKLCKNWQNFGEHNEKYLLEGPYGECIFVNTKTHQGYQIGYNGLMMEWMAKHIIVRIW